MFSTAISEFTTSCHVVCDGQPYFRPSGVLNVYSNKKLRYHEENASCLRQFVNAVMHKKPLNTARTSCKKAYAVL